MIRSLPALLFACCIAFSTAHVVHAQSAPRDRLFLSFAEDTELAETQWWEGQFEILDGEGSDALLLRGVAAFQPWKRIELGGTVGFGRTDRSGLLDDGSGATDLDLWGKYRFTESMEATDLAVGVDAIVPTGDDSVGLGSDAFSAGIFGTMRHRLPKIALSFHIGARVTGDGEISGFDVDGQTSGRLGGAVLWPVADDVTLIGEVTYEGERFKSIGDKDTRVLAGVNWRPLNQGMLRAALGVGLSDGSPDLQFVAGYAAQF